MAELVEGHDLGSEARAQAHLSSLLD
jgi:hypothetical protein